MPIIIPPFLQGVLYPHTPFVLTRAQWNRSSWDWAISPQLPRKLHNEAGVWNPRPSLTCLPTTTPHWETPTEGNLNLPPHKQMHGVCRAMKIRRKYPHGIIYNGQNLLFLLTFFPRFGVDIKNHGTTTTKKPAVRSNLSRNKATTIPPAPHVATGRPLTICRHRVLRFCF